ncbi:Carboxylesterase NlhH 2 [Colletotrichum chlorophyti]|uniref:Carboxylesterase NlhH 2 n=1 Tax=Colletotrichum chlorophyti TaxID=708187 RepID=A0A1Q8RPJ2_9PEZI|nr:Carboxylesterase NlhH 2 [Colletotrichum chlorophyti]
MASNAMLPTRSHLKPPYDPQLVSAMTIVTPFPRLKGKIAEGRQVRATAAAPLQASIRNDADLVVEDRTIPGLEEHLQIPVIILQLKNSAGAADGQRPGILYFHGGGMVIGDPFLGLSFFVHAAKEHDAVLISVDYRLAPEHPAPAMQDDCFVALVWVSQHARELGIDPSRIMVSGVSAGGGLAAGVALRARDEGGPKLCAQLLVCPMLDDRDTSVSKKQYTEETFFDGTDNNFSWSCVLGDQAGVQDADVSPYVAPGRATDLSGLPPAYIDVGTAEPFRDEDVAYATKLWECGVQADLHVWSGGFHGFDIIGEFVGADISKAALDTKMGWIRRIFSKR